MITNGFTYLAFLVFFRRYGGVGRKKSQRGNFLSMYRLLWLFILERCCFLPSGYGRRPMM